MMKSAACRLPGGGRWAIWTARSVTPIQEWEYLAACVPVCESEEWCLPSV